jgi:L-rhamnose mutarotase
LEKVLKDHGVFNCSIFLHTETLHCFGYAKVESEEKWAAIALTEACRRWWQHISDARISGRLTGTCKMVSCIT